MSKKKPTIIAIHIGLKACEICGVVDGTVCKSYVDKITLSVTDDPVDYVQELCDACHEKYVEPHNLRVMRRKLRLMKK